MPGDLCAELHSFAPRGEKHALAVAEFDGAQYLNCSLFLMRIGHAVPDMADPIKLRTDDLLEPRMIMAKRRTPNTGLKIDQLTAVNAEELASLRTSDLDTTQVVT